MDSLVDLLNPETLIRVGGVELLIVIIFIETGMVFGFFLPGDSLLFIAGMLCSADVIKLHVLMVCILLIFSAVLGSLAGYVFGIKMLTLLSRNRRLLSFKVKYLDATKKIFDKYGMWVFVFGRFIPGVRTFVPIFAGVSNLPWQKFMVYNAMGAAVWVFTMVLAGYSLGNAFPVLTERIEWIVVGIVGLTLIPFAYGFITSNRKQ